MGGGGENRQRRLLVLSGCATVFARHYGIVVGLAFDLSRKDVMNTVKLSRYAHLVTSRDKRKVLVFGGRHGGLGEIDQEVARKIASGEYDGIEDSVRNELVRAGILVEDSVDEVGQLMLRCLQAVMQTDALGLTLVPTSACNFD